VTQGEGESAVKAQDREAFFPFLLRHPTAALSPLTFVVHLKS
jgi:hypothetical protein